MSQSPSSRQDRIRVSQACENCRDKKSKCDGVKPVCGRCQLKSLECHYGMTKRIKNQQVMKELATKVAQYESLLKKNIPAQQRILEQSTVAPFMLNTSLSPTQSDTTSGLPTGPLHDRSTSRAITASSSSVSRRPSEVVSPTVTTNYSADTWPRSTIDGIAIPPRSVLERAVKSCLQGTALVFPFFDDDEIPTMMEDVYSNATEGPSTIALVQLCITAAVGCQYYPKRHDATTRVALLSIAKFKMEDCIEEAPLPAMRILALLAMYHTFEKRTAALMYIDMGLRLARMHRHKTMVFEHPPTVWQRVYGSLIFLDCWLCSTTGHLPSLQNRELHSSMVIMGHVNAPLATTVHFEMIKIAILSTSILQDIYHARYVSSVTITSYKNQLQQWLLALPEFMRLDSLLTGGENAHQLRPTFIVHLLYMITIILVYRRVLVELSSLGRKWSDHETFNHTQSFLGPCLWTGRQIARILEISLSQGQILPKCWMYIYATYSTCNVLLYFVATRLVHDDFSEGLERDFAAAKQCIDVLEFCATEDEAAKQYFHNVSNIYDEILETHSAISSMVADKDEERLVKRKENLQRMIALSAAMLMHPFDGGYRREVRDMADMLLRPVDDPVETSFTSTARSDTEMLSPGHERTTREGSTNIFLNDFLNAVPAINSRGKNKASGQGSDDLSFLSTKGIFFGS